MKAEEFCYWLQGYFELCPGCSTLNEKQVQVIRNHLAPVFRHDIDPKAGPPEYQQELQALHDGKPTTLSIWNRPSSHRC